MKKFRQLSLGDHLFNTSLDMFTNQGHFWQALSYMRKAREMFLMEKNWPEFISCSNELLTAYQLTSQLTKFVPLLEETMEIGHRELGDCAPELTITYCRRGRYLCFTGELEEAFLSYKKALEHSSGAAEQQSSQLHLSEVYGDLGYLYAQNLYDYRKALSYFMKELELKSEVLGWDDPDISLPCSNVAFAYQKLEEYERALEHYEIAHRQRLLQSGRDSIEVVSLEASIAWCKAHIGRVDEAIEMSTAALQFVIAKVGEDHTSTASIYQCLAYCYDKKGQFPNAYKLHKKAISVAVDKDGEDREKVMEIRWYFGNHYSAQGLYDKAIWEYQKSLRYICPEDKEDKYKNPVISLFYEGSDYSWIHIFGPRLLMLLGSKARSFISRYRQVPDVPKYLLASYETYAVVGELIKLLQLSFKLEGDKFLLEESDALLREGIDVSQRMLEITGDQTFLKRIHMQSELMSNNYLLNSQLRDVRTKETNIDRALTGKERELRARLGILCRQVYSPVQKRRAGDEEINFNQKYLLQRAQYQTLLSKFASRYPDYFEIKFKHNLAAFDEIQSRLTENEAFLKFWSQHKSIYILGITSSQSMLEKVALPEEFETLLKDFSRTIDLYSKRGNETMRFEIWEQIWEPVERSFGNMTKKRMHIVLSDIFAFLQFDAVVDDPSKESNHLPADLFYSGNNLQIAYYYSATSWLNGQAAHPHISGGMDNHPIDANLLSDQGGVALEEQ